MYPLVLENIHMVGRPYVGVRWNTADNTIAGGVGFWLSSESLGVGEPLALAQAQIQPRYR